MTKKTESEKNQDALKAAARAMLTAKPEPSKHSNRQRRTSAGLWSRPFASEALGVNPDQVAEANEELRRHGCTAEYNADGQCVVTSDKQFREVAKISGLWNGRDGYGVPNCPTGRERERRKEEFRRAVEQGVFD